MYYKFLLFDMDDTIFDFQQTEKVAFRKVMEQNHIEYSDGIVATYKRINHRLWTDYELGKIKKDEIFTRFDQLMAALKLTIDGRELERQYRGFLGEGTYLMPDAKDVIKTLSGDHEMYIVTNGTAATQRQRLESSGLDTYFKDIFISEDIGAAKPSEIFFEYVEQHIPDFSKDVSLIIGDSLICDIGGGKKAGIDTCWMNRKCDQKPSNDAVYTICGLTELLDIV